MICKSIPTLRASGADTTKSGASHAISFTTQFPRAGYRAAKKKYAPYSAARRPRGLNHSLTEMLGEVTIAHVISRRCTESAGSESRLLGDGLTKSKMDASALRASFNGENWNPDLRAPPPSREWTLRPATIFSKCNGADVHATAERSAFLKHGGQADSDQGRTKSGRQRRARSHGRSRGRRK